MRAVRQKIDIIAKLLCGHFILKTAQNVGNGIYELSKSKNFRGGGMPPDTLSSLAHLALGFSIA